MTIKTADIKKSLHTEYGKGKWTRITKRVFNYNNVSVTDKITLNGKINWRAFTCEHLNDPVFTFDDGDEILLVTGCAFIPGEAFDGAIFPHNEENGGFALFLNLKDSFSIQDDTEIHSDNIHENIVAGLCLEFEKEGFDICGIMENMFSITPDENIYFDNYEVFENKVLPIIAKLGITYSKDLENELYEDLEFDNKKDFIKNRVNILNRDDFYSFLREEYEELDE